MPRARMTSRLVHRTSITLAAITCLGAVGLGGYNLASADIEQGSRPVFVPITPCRLLDTRAAATVGGRDTPLNPAETLVVRAHGANGRCTGDSAIPTDAVGLSMNVVAAQPTQRTFLTFWGDGLNPGTANLNPEPGQAPTPNAVNTPLSTAGNFNIFNNAGNVEVIIDVNGYYANHNHDDRYPTDDEVDGAVDGIDTRVDGIDTSITDIGTRIGSVEGRVDGIDSGIDGIGNRIDNVDNRIDDVDVRIDSVEGNLPFLAIGRVFDDETMIAALTAFSGPQNTSAVISELGAAGEGRYMVTVSGLDGQVSGVVQITPQVDPNPGLGTQATACSISSVTSTATTFEFVVGCFGDDDFDENGLSVGPSTGDIVAEDLSFQFAIIG